MAVKTMDLGSFTNMRWDALIGAALSGGLLTKGIDLVAQKGRTRAYTMGAVDHAVETALKSVTSEVERLNAKIKDVEDRHHDCESELEQSRRDREALRDELRRKIDALMRGPVPPYGDPIPGQPG